MAMKILNYLKTRVEVRLYCYKRSAELKCRTVITDFEDYFIDSTDTYDFDVTIMVALPRLYNYKEIRSKQYINVPEYNEVDHSTVDRCTENYKTIFTGFSKTSVSPIVSLTMCTPILEVDVAIPFIPNGLYHYAYNSVTVVGDRIDAYNSYYWLNRYLLFMESLYKQQNDTCTVLLYGNNDPNKVLMDVIDKDYNKVTFKNDLLPTTLEFYPDGYAILYYGCLRVVMCHYPVSHKRSVTLLANSQEPLFVTGDQTFTEALSVSKMFMYQQFTWKYALVDAFINNINAYIKENASSINSEYIMEFFEKSMYCSISKTVSEQVDELVSVYNSVNKSVFIEYCEHLHNINIFYKQLIV
jgi:hypothetical protein